MTTFLIKNARIVNEGQIIESDLLIEDERIARIDQSISHPRAKVIDAAGKILLPGIIDDQVHFREPGMEYKGNIASESAAAAAGGITSYIEQPNTKPPATTIELLNEKFDRASISSMVNYSFNFGATNDNLDEILKAEKSRAAGVKIFMGSSTGNMLVDDQKSLERIFSESPLLLITHCEDESVIRENTAHFKAKNEEAKAAWHPLIRSEEACYRSSSFAVELAKKHGSRLHVFHLSTAKETALFDNSIPLIDKKITAEVCIHHLWFNDRQYAEKGNFIKWNPAVKTEDDQLGLWKALIQGKIDVIATDHAPHSLDEKQKNYWEAPSGGPMVQHALPAMLEFYHKGVITLEMIVEKMCHNPAILFRIKERGYIREGYYADLCLVDLNNPWTVSKDNLRYRCRWSPMEGETFSAKVTHTFVNGGLVYENGKIHPEIHSHALQFNR